MSSNGCSMYYFFWLINNKNYRLVLLSSSTTFCTKAVKRHDIKEKQQ